MMRTSSAILLALLLTACKDGGSGRPENPMNPDRPPPVTDPDPERGTVLKEGCSENFIGVKWFRIADGEGGYYVEKDNRSEECGYVPIVLNVEIDNEYGDRFKPVVVTVDYTENGEALDWEYGVGIGRAVKADANTLHIYGDGRLGEDFVTIEGERYTYTIREEPRCPIEVAGQGFRKDCAGYVYRGSGADGLIYYGEDDDQIVEWQIAVVYNTGQNQPNGITILEPNDPLWERSREKVEAYNEVYERHGVHIRYRLTTVAKARINVEIMSGRQVTGWFDDVPADILAGIGGSCPNTCGCAAVRSTFRENGRGLGMNSDCGEITDLHEIGHSVGLAHGPDNRENQAEGYIFPNFGHGYSTPFCGRYTDLMSYAPGSVVINNSLQTCGDWEGWGDYSIKESEYDDPAGDRAYADSAYHLNRVRYDVALINCMADGQCVSSPAYRENVESVEAVEGDELIIIKDDIDDVHMGRQMREDLHRKLGTYDLDLD